MQTSKGCIKKESPFGWLEETHFKYSKMYPSITTARIPLLIWGDLSGIQKKTPVVSEEDPLDNKLQLVGVLMVRGWFWWTAL